MAKRYFNFQWVDALWMVASTGRPGSALPTNNLSASLLRVKSGLRHSLILRQAGWHLEKNLHGIRIGLLSISKECQYGNEIEFR